MDLVRGSRGEVLAHVQTHVLGASHHVQVLAAIIGLALVSMMHDFVTAKPATEDALHHETVLEDVAPGVRIGMIGRVDQDVSAPRDSPALPLVARCAATNGHDVTGESRDRMSSEIALRAEGDLRDLRCAPTSAFAATGGDLVISRDVPVMRSALLRIHSGVVTWDEAWTEVALPAPPPLPRDDRTTASACAELHAESVDRCPSARGQKRS